MTGGTANAGAPGSIAGYRAAFEELVQALPHASTEHYGDRLVSLAVFGSVGRGTMRPDSDMDLLVVADPLPAGRLRRVADFAAVEETLAPALLQARARGVNTSLSALFKTPEEVRAHSPILLDMMDDARILFDRQGIEPPKWHDVSDFLVENAGRFPASVRVAIPRLTQVSKWLRKERELAFYGDIDFVPTEEYGPEEARRAMDDAAFVVATAESLLAATGGRQG
ncbi:MAG: nucleotidyltransferase domain-containing protein [Lentisphaerae bacterium]|nr:nucleotidyltransferase domain-containing protein [Lentisphaerota bacterium]